LIREMIPISFQIVLTPYSLIIVILAIGGINLTSGVLVTSF